MAKEAGQFKEQNEKMVFDWKSFMSFLYQGSGETEKIGRAWVLLFDIVQNMNRSGIYQTTYAALAQKYGVSMATVKKWRKWLCKSGVIESYSRGHSVAFRLLESYMSFFRPISKGIEDNEDIQGLLILKRLLTKTVNDQELRSLTS